MWEVLLFSAVVSVVGATKGVDTSQRYTSASTWECLARNGYSFAIVRAYQSFGRPDPNAKATVMAAKAAGIKYVDVYIFPDPRGSKSARQQARDTLNALSGANYGQVWIDVEAKSPYWPGSQATNRQFILDMASEIKAMGKKPGIYSSYYNWQSIVGLSWTGVSNLPLWYAHYDNNPSFSDFRSFGGWSNPNIKQYSDRGNACGASFDVNYY